MTDKLKLLIVDDEAANLEKLKRTFVDDFEVYEARSGSDALELLHQIPISAVITDQRMPGMTGVELLCKSLEVREDIVRIVLTGYTETDDLMDSINQGHVHRYITKPWDPTSLREVVLGELERWELEQEQDRLAKELGSVNDRLERENLKLRQAVELLQDSPRRLIHRSYAMKELLQSLDRVVPTDSTVLMQGETGTGKELLARYVHEHSPRRDEPFVPVNCGAVPSDLVESAFFGHRKGAFTGAIDSRKGYFELAHGGTIFLDEIGEASLDLQVKLLRVLQEGEIYPVGAEASIDVDVRVIASTNRNLSQQVEEGKFRQDLFYRLNVFAVFVPPLRGRREDVDVLSEFFVKRFCKRLNRPLLTFEPDTLQMLREYDWPGNVRELENEIERVVILADPGRPIPASRLSDRIRVTGGTRNSRGPLKEKLAALERELILDALRAHGNNKSRAADALQVSRQTIIAKLKQYGLPLSD